MTTQTDGEAVLKEMVEATDPATVHCLGLTHHSLSIDSVQAIAAYVDHLQSALKESIRLQGEYAAKVEQLTAERDASLARVSEMETWKSITDAQKDGKEYICIDAEGSVFQAKWWNDVDGWLQYGTDWVAPKQYLMESPARAMKEPTP